MDIERNALLQLLYQRGSSHAANSTPTLRRPLAYKVSLETDLASKEPYKSYHAKSQFAGITRSHYYWRTLGTTNIQRPPDWQVSMQERAAVMFG